MPDYIHRLILEGEHQRLDFKFEISDSRKIARTLVAFANTDGGRLLVGVKDNGAIAGVRSEEEIFMVEGAARLYCRPEVSFAFREWNVEGRRVVEFLIAPGEKKPYMAQGEDGRWLAWVRRHDQNLKANSVIIKVWKSKQSDREASIEFGAAEKMLLSYLEQHDAITMHGFRKLARIPRQKAERVLVAFILMGVIEQEIGERGASYRLCGRV
jgi:predicted HTH transcriptional regulator